MTLAKQPHAPHLPVSVISNPFLLIDYALKTAVIKPQKKYNLLASVMNHYLNIKPENLSKLLLNFLAANNMKPVEPTVVRF